MDIKMKISIITPVLNGERYIEETIKSVLNQKVKYELEYIIMDGGSTDGTISIIEKYMKKYSEGNYKENFLKLSFFYISEKDKGLYDALYKGLTLCTGEIVGWINADDFYIDGAFNKICGVFNDLPQVNWLTGRCNVLNESRQFMVRSSLRFYQKDFIRKGAFGIFSDFFIPQESTFWRRGLMEKIQISEFTQYKLAGDFYLWNSFALNDELYSLDEDLAVFRFTGHNLSANKAEYRVEMMQIMDHANIFSDRDRVLFRSYSEVWHNIEGRYYPYIRKIGDTWKIVTEKNKREHDKRTVTIVTVCRNEKNIRYTCESIVNQTWGNYEWIVVDGASTDGTLEVIKEYEDYIDELVSEPDTGVYGAMNKGIRKANGEWIIFMNGGDQFHDFYVLERIFKDREYKSDVLYGDEERFDKYGKSYIYTLPSVIPAYFMCYRSFAHQAMFYRKELFTRYGLYDESYKISGDSEKNTQLLQQGVDFLKIDYVVSSYMLDGLSNDEDYSRILEEEQKRRRLKYFSEKDVELYKNGMKKSSVNIKIPIVKIKSFHNGRTKKYYLFGIILLFTAKRFY